MHINCLNCHSVLTNDFLRQEKSNEPEESQTRSNVLFSHDYSGYHLKISRERNSRFAGSMTAKNSKSHQEVCKILRHLDTFRNIRTLNLAGCSELQDRDLEKVPNVSSLTVIDLSGVNVSAHMIKRLLNANRQVEKLTVIGNPQIEEKDLKDIFLLGKNLIYVNLARCTRLKDEDVMNVQRPSSMALVLPSGRVLNICSQPATEIYVPSINHIYSLIDAISDREERRNVYPVVSKLLHQRSIDNELCLTRHGIGDDGAQVLAAVLKVNRFIQKLDLSDNTIGDKGAKALACLLEANPWIRELNLSKNQIGIEGAQALVIALEKNQTLQKLDFSENQIGVKGVQALAVAVKVNQSIRQLILYEEQIGEEGVEVLAVALKTNQILENLKFCFAYLNYSSPTAYTIATLLQANRQMKNKPYTQIKAMETFLNLLQGQEGITLLQFQPLQELLQKWHGICGKIVPMLKEIANQSGRTKLNDEYKAKFEDLITNLTNCLQEIWLELFEQRLIALSNEYVIDKKSFEERNSDLGYALYETWSVFVGSGYSKWVEDHLQSFIPFGVLLDIAEGGGKKDVSELKDLRLLFQRVLSFKDEKLKKSVITSLQ